MNDELRKKRLFYLMLSTAEGQTFAQFMGFHPSSPDVCEAETNEVLLRWAIMLETGIMVHITESSEWFTDFLEETNNITSSVLEFKSILTLYGVGLINKLLEEEVLGINFSKVGSEDE